VPALRFEELADSRPSGPTSPEVRAQVQACRDLQRARYGDRYRCNAQLDSKAVRKYCTMTDGAKALLESAMDRLGLSARAYDKILRVARTLADLEQTETLAEPHLAEAVQYRSVEQLG